MRVLVIDEMVSHFAPISEQLKQRGVEVVVARSGDSVSSLLDIVRPDVLVIDPHQPVPAENVMSEVKDSGWELPVVVLSGTALSRYRGFDFVDRSLGLKEVTDRILTAGTIGTLMQGVSRITCNLEKCYGR